MSDRPESSNELMSDLMSELAALRQEVSRLKEDKPDEEAGARNGDPTSAIEKSAATNGAPVQADDAPSPKSKPAGKPTPAAQTSKQPPPLTKTPKSSKKPAKEKRPEQDELAEDKPSRWSASFLSGGLIQQFGAWSFSIIIHMVVMILLALWMLPGLLEPDSPELSAVAERPQDELTELLEEDLTPDDAVALTQSSNSPLQSGHTSTIKGLANPTFDHAVAEQTNAPTVKIDAASIDSVPGGTFTLPTADDAPGDPHAIVDSYDEAMDRITQEILLMLEKDKVLVTWCFDQSGSMKDDQEEIRTRISKVYQELGLKGATKNDALLTAVVSYGAGWQTHTEPTNNVERIEQGIAAVPNDETGKEMMCMAVGFTLKKFERYASRRQALILVTDESGDRETNVSLLEAAIAQARRARCRIYVLGRESVFGYPFAHYLWRHPQTGHLHKIPIDRGPETPYAEQLQTSGFRRRYDSHPSGFGPYEQCRMARETGGIFFMLPSIETNVVQDDANALRLLEAGKINREDYRKTLAAKRRFKLEALRSYMPSLDSRREYLIERQSSPLRSDLWTVISTLNPYDPQKAKVIEMRLRFTGNPAAFAREVRQELVKTKLYFEFLKLAEQELEEQAANRSKEIYPRWQANYDLVRAQVIAYKVRLHEYGAYLTTFSQALSRSKEVRENAIALLGKDPTKFPLQKPHPSKKPGHFLRLAYWEVIHRSQTMTGELTREDIERSRRMFENVIKDHPDTPWSDRAAWELRRGFGVELVERYHHHGPPSKRPPSKPVKRVPVPKL